MLLFRVDGLIHPVYSLKFVCLTLGFHLSRVRLSVAQSVSYVTCRSLVPSYLVVCYMTGVSHFFDECFQFLAEGMAIHSILWSAYVRYVSHQLGAPSWGSDCTQKCCQSTWWKCGKNCEHDSGGGLCCLMIFKLWLGLLREVLFYVLWGPITDRAFRLASSFLNLLNIWILNPVILTLSFLFCAHWNNIEKFWYDVTM
jgi:hypothetical protein